MYFCHCIVCLRQEAKPTEIAFDLECYNKSNYTQMTCLLQLAINNGKEYVIDPLAPGVWESVGGLAPLFANPDIVKIGHSIGGLDVRCLHRDFGIFVVNAFDTYEAAQCLNLPSKGLAKVCGNYGLPDCEIYESLKEKYQTTDWTKRPLTKPMIQYGRYDVHYLIKIRRLMMRDLVKQELGDKSNKATKDAEAKQVATSLAAVLRRFDEDEETFDDDDDFATPTNVSFDEDEDEDEYEETELQEEGEQRSFFDAKALRMNVDLMQAISRSQDRCLDLWNDNVEPHLKNSEFRSLVVRSKKGEIQWTSSQLELYEKLAQWRELVAAREECTGGCVCPLGLLANIALRRPTNEVGLQLLRSHLPDLLEDTSTNNNTNEVFQLVLESRQADGLEECDYSEIPRYEDYLARERMGYFVDRSVPSESIGGFSGLVAAGVVACVAAIAVTVVAASKRSR
jgi:ribonuclease D